VLSFSFAEVCGHRLIVNRPTTCRELEVESFLSAPFFSETQKNDCLTIDFLAFIEYNNKVLVGKHARLCEDFISQHLIIPLITGLLSKNRLQTQKFR